MSTSSIGAFGNKRFFNGEKLSNFPRVLRRNFLQTIKCRRWDEDIVVSRTFDDIGKTPEVPLI